MDKCVQIRKYLLSLQANLLKLLDMKSSQCKTESISYTTVPEYTDLIRLLTSKYPYFTHMGTWQSPWREAAEPYLVLSIIPIH